MNCSEPTRRRRKHRKAQWGAILFWVVVGFILGMLTTHVFAYVNSDQAQAVEISTPSPEPAPPPTTSPPKPAKTLLGEWRITAYCGCETCCGEWAKNRPDGIVYGAAGVELTPGVSIAADLPFGTAVEIEGLGDFVVEDRMAQWVVDQYNGETIDVYLADHAAARAFGLQYHNVYIWEE